MLTRHDILIIIVKPMVYNEENVHKLYIHFFWTI